MPRTTFRNDMTITGTLTVTGGIIRVPTNGTAVAGAVTIAAMQGKVTTEALTTAQNANYTLTITNSQIAAADIVMVSIANGTNSAGLPILQRVTPAAGSVVIVIANKIDTATALNGTLVVSFLVSKAA